MLAQRLGLQKTPLVAGIATERSEQSMPKCEHNSYLKMVDRKDVIRYGAGFRR
jgi:hypothetical protein